MTALVIESIYKSFGTTDVLRDINLVVQPGEFVVFVGPSGCGKSTILRVIAGLEDASSGRVSINGRDVTALPPARRGIAMVFQSYALYPHLDVRGNMGLGLKHAGEARAVIDERIAVAAKMLELGPYLGRRPSELSGGQRQRVAIGRAIVRKPDLFLFDEPLSNLDAALRMAMRIEIARLHREIGAATIYVTHDQTEAMTLADRIVVLRDGRVEQIGSPMQLYNDPDNRFVAGFLGAPAMNFLDRPDGGSLGIRPEHLRLVDRGRIDGEVIHVERLGSDTNILVAVEGQVLTLRLFGQHPQTLGDRVSLDWDDALALSFDATGNRRRH